MTDRVQMELECGQCHARLRAGDQLLKFTFCGCSNRAQICYQNKKEDAYLLGATDQTNTFVFMTCNNVPLPKMSLERWNQLQYQFKTKGKLIE